MTFYLDTSLLVASLVEENATRRVQGWMRDAEHPFTISDWTWTEFVSAIAAKHRNRAISAEQKGTALTWFRAFGQDTASVFPVERANFRRAAELINTPQIKIRAADALHVAVAEAQRVTLCTLDQEQADAGSAVGVATLLI